VFSFLIKQISLKKREANKGQNSPSPSMWFGSVLFACGATALLFALATMVGKGVELFMAKLTGVQGHMGNVMPLFFLLFMIFAMRLLRSFFKETRRDLDEGQAFPLTQLGSAISAGAKVLIGRLFRRATLEVQGREELKALVAVPPSSSTETPDPENLQNK
jgi:hypothetical protein